MSSAHDAPEAHAGSAHPTDAHAHEVFTGEPVDTLPADEPRTPGWLTLLGMGLFVSAGVLFLLDGDHADASATKLTPMDLPAPPAPAPQAAPGGAQAAHMMPVGQPGGGEAIRKMSPQQMDELRKKIDEARAKGALPPQGQGRAPTP